MIYSMTGYGKGTAGKKNFSVEAEVKSVNSRYLDIYLKLPSALMNKEYELREIIKNRIKRGKISIIFQLKKGDSEIEIPLIDKSKLKQYLIFIKELKKAAKINEKVKLEHLINSQELFLSAGADFSENEFNLVKEALNSALNELIKMKENEGKELAKDLQKRIKIIESRLEMIENESSSSINEYFEKLKEKIKLLVENITEYSDRLELELAIIAEKAEITEECVRLRSHIKFFLDSLEKDEEPGRKLNFLCQEMNREANTISSKSILTSIIHNTVMVKEEIEKIREQIQNIE